MARSTTEAELISMANGLFGEVYNIQSFLEQLTLGDIDVCFWQDNNAVLQVCRPDIQPSCAIVVGSIGSM